MSNQPTRDDVVAACRAIASRMGVPVSWAESVTDAMLAAGVFDPEPEIEFVVPDLADISEQDRADRVIPYSIRINTNKVTTHAQAN